MSLSVDYLVVYSGDASPKDLLISALRNAHIYAYNEPPSDDALSSGIEVRYIQRQENNHQIVGFTVHFDTQEDGAADLIEYFCQALTDSNRDGVEHVLKFLDPELFRKNQRIAQEIFEIEMKLREVLSLIFIDTYESNFYSLLEDVNVNTQGSVEESHMKTHYENEFFFMLFSDHIKLNDPKRLNLDRIVDLIRKASDFGELQRMASTGPVAEERYLDFLARLKSLVDPIEKVRNCVAHNRAIPHTVTEDYSIAKEKIMEAINEFFRAIAIEQAS